MTKTKNLFPEKRVSSVGFILNKEHKILLLKPSYYKYWHLPGGYVDEHESPLTAISREIQEEINLRLTPDRLLIINYEPGDEAKKEVLVMIFDFGIVDEKQFENLKVDNTEIIDSGLFTLSEAKTMVGPDRSNRLELCFKAHKENSFYYLDKNKLFPDVEG